ncbi:MAG: PaaI family thioesterase, partial [Polyangiales bacterium]
LIGKLFASMSPHMRALGFQVVTIEGGVCVARLPYSDDLIGDPISKVLHGGVVTSLLDTTGGAAVLSAVGQPLPLATLDLRIDYLRPSTPGRAVHARVECYKTTHNIAFTRGIAYDQNERDPVASMAATYMLRTQSTRRSESA